MPCRSYDDVLRKSIDILFDKISPSKLFSNVPASTVQVPVENIAYTSCWALDTDKLQPSIIDLAIRTLIGQSSLTETHRIGLCDRYGGRGVGSNGGAGRCLTIDKVQIKGCGVTPLFRGKDDSNPGVCDFSECIREIIYSNISDQILPFGAAKCYGVILLEEKFCSESNSNCALLLREPVLRPAHFLRAIRYGEESHSSLSADIERVTQNCKWLLVELIGATEGRLRKKMLVSTFIFSLAERLIKQIVIARWIGFCHGSINPSNVTISGGYVDFGTSSFLPPFANYRVAKLGYYSFDEWIAIPALLADLHHNLLFYGLEVHAGDFDLLIHYRKICAQMHGEFGGYLALLAAGFDRREVAKIPVKLRRSFHTHCVKIERLDGSLQDLSIDVQHHSSGRLADILMQIVISDGRNNSVDGESSEIQASRNKLIKIYAQMRAIAGTDDTIENYNRGKDIIGKITKQRKELYRPVLQEVIRNAKHGDMQLVRRLVDESTSSCSDLVFLKNCLDGVTNDFLSQG
jgi:uncharacterized protein YdiU (UPF0061 family)